MLSEKQLAERGALIRLGELREEMNTLYDTYPGLLQAERMAKREKTMLERYGTLNPHEAAEKVEKAEKKAKIKAKGNGPKVSHKKGMGKKAMAAKAAAAAAAQSEGAEAPEYGQPDTLPGDPNEPAPDTDEVEVSDEPETSPSEAEQSAV